MMERRFEAWDYQTVQQLEQLCRDLPIMPRTAADAFFEAASAATESEVESAERPNGRVSLFRSPSEPEVHQ